MIGALPSIWYTDSWGFVRNRQSILLFDESFGEDEDGVLGHET